MLDAKFGGNPLLKVHYSSTMLTDSALSLLQTAKAFATFQYIF